MSLMSRQKSKTAGRSRRRNEEGNFEYVFLAIVAMGMLALGVVMVFSASLARAYFENHDGYFYLKRELVFAGLGIVFMFGMAKYDFTRLRKVAPWLMAISIGLLVLVLILGISVNGSRRWLGAGPFVFQPAEFAKLAVIIFVACLLYTSPSPRDRTRSRMPS